MADSRIRFTLTATHEKKLNFWTAKDGTRYALSNQGFWLRFGFYEGMTTAHAIEFVEYLKENEFK